MTTISELKAEARKTAFAARKQAFAAGQGQAAALLADLMAEYGAKPLAGYMAMRTEIDPTDAMAAHQGPVGVPVIMGAGQPLRFRAWTPGCDLIEGEFGAKIPAEGAWIEPEILIVPMVAWDRRGFRLGYGGGFYDRTLEGLRAKRPTIAIGFAFAAQELAEVPVEPVDQPLDALVTETGVFRF